VTEFQWWWLGYLYQGGRLDHEGWVSLFLSIIHCCRGELDSGGRLDSLLGTLFPYLGAFLHMLGTFLPLLSHLIIWELSWSLLACLFTFGIDISAWNQPLTSTGRLDKSNSKYGHYLLIKGGRFTYFWLHLCWDWVIIQVGCYWSYKEGRYIARLVVCDCYHLGKEFPHISGYI